MSSGRLSSQGRRVVAVCSDGAGAPTYPLSRAQWGWWLAQQMYPAVPMTVALYLDLDGPLDAGLMARCARRAACELESPLLRLRVVDGCPRQYVDTDARLAFDIVDLSGEANPVAAALDRMERDHSTTLDPLADQLTVAVVFVVGPNRHLLYLRSHHIVLDGVGAAAVVRRTAQLYGSEILVGAAVAGMPRGVDDGLPDACALSVREISEEEGVYRQSPRAASDRDYWRGKLCGVGEPVGLGGRGGAPATRPHLATAMLDADTADLLSTAKARYGATFPELVIAAFACYLARMTGNVEVTLTLPVTARPTAALRRSAGSMSNVVPLRLGGLDTVTVGEAVARVRSAVIGALRHQRHRHEDIARDHSTLRDGFGPVVNVLGFTEPLRLGPATGQGRLLALGPVSDLHLNAYQLDPDKRSVRIDFQANPARYRHETIVRYHAMFVEYLRRFLAAEKNCLTMNVDAPVPPPPRLHAGPARMLPELLRADIAPHAVALRDRDRAFTYRHLDEMSSRLARVLMARGAGPGAFVVVAIPRSLESVLALWTVAKSGACYVPVDPDDPVTRIAAVIANCDARWGLTVRSVRARLPEGPGAYPCGGDFDWVVLDDPVGIVRSARHSGEPIEDGDRVRPLRPEHPAYLIHTSGTTGIPKGVVVGHRGLGALIDYLIEHYGITADSVLLHSHTATFDAHLLELLGAFAAGAQVVVAPSEVVVGVELARLIRENGCTIFQTAPAVLATLSPDQVPGLDVVAVGGEACPPTLAQQWAPRVRMFNGYGPTEVTVMATETTAMTAEEPITIGCALPGVLAVTLDARLGQVPAGARGELYLGGPAVADGYLGDPVGTAARFVANPFWTGQRLYRTGDSVRAGFDGAFEYLGRIDGQIELRGRRIEPAEIERALLVEPRIAYATVTVVDAGQSTARLVGHVVAADGIGIDTAAVLRRMRGSLPAALVPSALIELDRLPLSGNGKVDRSALPGSGRVSRPRRSPKTELQSLVAARFATGIGCESVCLDDDFFELGGNSLLGVTVSAELAAVTGVPVTVRWLFATPTVAELAERIESHDFHDDPDDALGVLLPLRRDGDRPPLFCVHSAVPLAWCYAGLVRYITDRPVYGLQAPGLVAGADAQSVEELLDSYLGAILHVQPHGPYHLLGWSLGGQIAHAIAVRLRARGATVAVLAMLDSVVVPAGLAPPATPRMRDLLTHLLGDEPDDADTAPDLTSVQAAAELAGANTSYGTGLSAGQLERLHRGYVTGVALSHSYRPEVYEGDLLYFSATRGVTGSLGVQMWRPHVTGALIEHPIAATHAQLTNSTVLAVIGPILADHLERVAAAEPVHSAL
ncbi:amino acid adenylation domain-containing protein [Nocardia aurea]|uniref:amino acid adenylation domain-containing protein n=1 Tax=Nocardia aurea TaxID=2144174 RepID=UPI0033BEA270